MLIVSYVVPLHYSFFLNGKILVYLHYTSLILFRAKADVARLLRLIQAMGGSIVKDANMKMTHLISKSSIGEKYNYACTFSLPVLTEDWLQTAWDNRENIGYRAAVKGWEFIPYDYKYITTRTTMYANSVTRSWKFLSWNWNSI